MSSVGTAVYRGNEMRCPWTFIMIILEGVE